MRESREEEAKKEGRMPMKGKSSLDLVLFKLPEIKPYFYLEINWCHKYRKPLI